MPYAPGIQDISGQLLGEGMTRASNIKAQATSNLGKTIADTLVGGIKQYQQNEGFKQQSLAKFTERMQDPEFKQYVDNILADESNKMGVPDSIKSAFRNAQTGKLKAHEASTLATIAQDYAERKTASEKTKQINLQNQTLEAEIDQRKKLSKIFEAMQNGTSGTLDSSGRPVITSEQASNASQFLPGAAVFGMGQQPFKQPARSKYDEVISPSSVATVNAAYPIDQYRSLRPSDVAFGPTALAASRFAGPVSPLSNIPVSTSAATPVSVPIAARAPVPVNVPIPVTARVPIIAPTSSIDPAVLQTARQRFDEAIAAPNGQFTLPNSNLSSEAKSIAKKLREQFDDYSAISEKRAASPRLTAAEDDSKAGSLKNKRTITLDEDGIKAIISNPQILVESFGDVMGSPYEKAMRNEATDKAWAAAANLRALERQFGVSPARSTTRRAK